MINTEYHEKQKFINSISFNICYFTYSFPCDNISRGKVFEITNIRQQQSMFPEYFGYDYSTFCNLKDQNYAFGECYSKNKLNNIDETTETIIVYGLSEIAAKCYAGKGGMKFDRISGGSLRGIKIHVWGKDYSNWTVDRTFDITLESDPKFYRIQGLEATHTAGDGNRNSYSVQFSDSQGNYSEIYKIQISQPEYKPLSVIGLRGNFSGCHNSSSGCIEFSYIAGGNTMPYCIAHVTGSDFLGNPVDKWIDSLSVQGNRICDLKASYTYGDLKENAYRVTFTDLNACYAESHLVSIAQYPQILVKAELSPKGYSLDCKNKDKNLVFNIAIGATRGDSYSNFFYKWEAYKDKNHTQKLESLLNNQFGLTSTFLGYGNVFYRIYAEDAHCESYLDTCFRYYDKENTRNYTIYASSNLEAHLATRNQA